MLQSVYKGTGYLSSKMSLKTLIAVTICIIVEVLVITLYIGYNQLQVDVKLSLVSAEKFFLLAPYESGIKPRA